MSLPPENAHFLYPHNITATYELEEEIPMMFDSTDPCNGSETQVNTKIDASGSLAEQEELMGAVGCGAALSNKKRDEHHRIPPSERTAAKHKGRRNIVFDPQKISALQAKLKGGSDDNHNVQADIDVEIQEIPISRQYSQEEFLRRAQKFAKLNKEKRRNYLINEEEKRALKTTAKRPTVEGESLRFISHAQVDANGDKYAQNSLVHTLGDSNERPNWNSTMDVLFGDHVDWDKQWTWNGKNRPLGRERRMCPITGLPAKYLDPRTGAPYADKRAYATLTALLNHEHIWAEDPSTTGGGWYTN